MKRKQKSADRYAIMQAEVDAARAESSREALANVFRIRLREHLTPAKPEKEKK